MLTGYYDGGNPANVSWQASQIVGGACHFGVTDHTRWSHAAQQGKEKKLNHNTTFVFWKKTARAEKKKLKQ